MQKGTENIDLKRVKKLVKYLIYRDYAEDQKELAAKLGYTAGTFSSVLSGKRELTSRFINKLLEVDNNVNKGYIFSDDENFLQNEVYNKIDSLLRENQILEELIQSKNAEIKRLQEKIEVLKKVNF